ncbi:MAG: AMP-binding protein, partial [Planctomycetes bacterium]|nr:AMP-binding protein [Planctomycetota bacterium]
GVEGTRVIPYKPLLDGAIDLAERPPARCLILQRPMAHADLVSGRDSDWDEAMAGATAHECVPVAATDPLYILYTSGTTGVPKGIVRDHGGHAVALHWSMRNVYGVEPGETFWAASDVGWVVGHSYIVYGPLLHGNTTVMFEGKPVGTPDPGAFWRVVADHGVVTMFTAPTAFRAIKQHDFHGEWIAKYDLSRLRALFLAGERCDPDTLHWAEQQLRVPVIDHWWQTETGWPIAANCLGLGALPIKAGSPTKAVPGWDVHVLDAESGARLPAGQMGEIACKLPLPPGSLPTLWNAEDHFVKRYLTRFPGYYQTDDAGYLDEDDYLFVMARTDDIINVAGHRLSTGAIEEVIVGHEDVAECAVFGVADELKGEVPIGLMTLEDGVDRDPAAIVDEVIANVRAGIGPIAVFKRAAIVARLPKTRSGKILRGTMRKIANGQEWRMPATIDDPAVLDEVTAVLGDLGYPHGD